MLSERSAAKQRTLKAIVIVEEQLQRLGRGITWYSVVGLL